MNGDRRSYANYRKALMSRYIKNGMRDLPSEDILELLLSFTKNNRNTRQLVNVLIERYGTIIDAQNAPMSELLQLPGMNADKAVLLKFTRDFSEHCLNQSISKKDLP